MGSNQKSGIATGAVLAGLALAPFTGGLSLGMTAAATGAAAAGGAAIGGTLGKKAENAQKKLTGSLLKPIEAPKVMPTIDAQAVQDSRNNTLTQLRARSGRASTLLTNSNTFGG